jgi:hypothetical protein
MSSRTTSAIFTPVAAHSVFSLVCKDNGTSIVSRFIFSVEEAVGAVSGDLWTQALSGGDTGFTCRKSCFAIAHHPDESCIPTTIRLYDTKETLILIALAQ